jgi:PAS domain S-box-containing protein
MESFELAKRRAALFNWLFLLIASMTLITSSDVKGHYAILAALMLGVVLNLSLAFPSLRSRVMPSYFFAILISFSIIAAIVAYHLKADFQTFYLFLIPVLTASLSFSLPQALAMAALASVLDYISFAHTGPSAHQVFPMAIIASRVLFYFIAAVVIGFFVLDNRRSMEEKDKWFMETQEKITELNTLRRIVECEKSKEAQFREALNREIKQRETLVDITKTLTETLELSQLLTHLLKTIKNFMDYTTGGIFLLDRTKNEIYCAASEGAHGEEMKRQVEDPSVCMPGIVIKKNQPIIINDTEKDPRFTSIMASKKINSAIYLPIFLKDVVYGSICLWNDTKNAYSDESQKFLTAICHEAARAIKNAELYRALDTRLNFIVALWNTSKNLASVIELSPHSRKDIVEKVLETIRVLFEVDGLIFYRYDKNKKSLVPFIVNGLSRAQEGGEKDSRAISEVPAPAAAEFDLKEYAFGEQEISEAHLMDSPFQVADLGISSFKKVFQPYIKSRKIVSLFWSPLVGRERPIGSLVFLLRRMREWKGEEVQWAEIFCTMFSMSLENLFLLDDIFTEKNQLEVLVDSMPEGVFTTDTERKILTWNKAAQKITGWSSAEVLGKDCEMFIKCQTVDKTLCSESCFIKSSMDNLSRRESDIESTFIVGKDGQNIPVYITTAPIYGKREKASACIFVFRDITREKEIEQMKEDFLATVTHDLKSPLASIMGYSELMNTPAMGELNKNQKEFMDAIERSCRTLQLLVENILATTRLEDGQMQYTMYDFEVNELLSEMNEMFLPLANNKNIKLIAEANGKLCAHGDREKIKEVISNLLSNSVKFTPEGGTIALRSSRNNGEIQFSISDTGKGIPNEEIPRLFQKFSQLKGEKRGTGLGLYIIKKILEAHGKEIRVESTPGKGSTFTFSLDARDKIAGSPGEKEA